MSNIRNKSAIVTGATKGIGLSITRGLLAEGARVAICARDRQELERREAELRSRFGESNVFGRVCDVSKWESVKDFFSEVKHSFGGLDILVNNAGVGFFGNAEEMTVEQWQATMGTNLSGVFFCSREAIPLMKEGGGGYIINIGSLAGKNPFAGGAAYCASKAGLISFSEALMQEVRYDHIRVSCVMPGSVNTEFGRSGEQDPETTWKLLPEDVAGAVINLLETNRRALSSRVEVRPSEPKK
jgi:NAD(P)-dependent dehydrogenase (short-subunit alcohol dehydrogenase family)